MMLLLSLELAGSKFSIAHGRAFFNGLLHFVETGDKTMRKVFALLLILAVLLCGCSQAKVTASAKAVSLAKQAVEAIDGYLDGTMSYKDAHDAVEEVTRKMEYASNYKAPDWTEEQKTDWFIHSALVSAGHDLIMDNYEGTPETYDEIVKQRNEIAELVGVDKR